MIINRTNPAQQNCQTQATGRKKLKAYHFILEFCCSFCSFFLFFFQSDTEFWDKMQAEWEEMARRNWISENQEAPGQVTISTIEKVTQSF